jgi:hypothetical protein
MKALEEALWGSAVHLLAQQHSVPKDVLVQSAWDGFTGDLSNPIENTLLQFRVTFGLHLCTHHVGQEKSESVFGVRH